ncbi:hypothetical protein SSX86_012630 [Deinandra increscens subsp. villosa]|uniref:Uncharacterized protein n=1 Tax=Deinandra increscens subsp. villosa TaxID=3103831 RepID=A0AAP0D4L3_9ASTR
MNNSCRLRLLLRRGYATRYSGRVVTEMDNGRSLAVEVQVPNLQILDPRGYPLVRRELVCKAVNILSKSSLPFIDLSDYLETLTLTLTVSEASEILKSLHSESIALQFFRFCQSSIPKFRHDCFTYNRMLLILSKSSSPDRFDSVRRIVDEMERSRVRGNISTVNILIGIFSGGEDLNRCLRLVERWELRMNRYTYKCLLQAHLRARDSNKGLEVYQEMRRKGYQPDIFAYNMLLDALAKDDKVDQANKVFEDMKKKHCEPDEYTYTILMRMSGKHGKPDDSIALFQEMESEAKGRNRLEKLEAVAEETDKIGFESEKMEETLGGEKNENIGIGTPAVAEKAATKKKVRVVKKIVKKIVKKKVVKKPPERMSDASNFSDIEKVVSPECNVNSHVEIGKPDVDIGDLKEVENVKDLEVMEEDASQKSGLVTPSLLDDQVHNELQDSDQNQIDSQAGDQNPIELQDGDQNRIELQDGDPNRIELQDGDQNRIELQDGDQNRIELQDGDQNRIELQDGDQNRIELQDGDQNGIELQDNDQNGIGLLDREPDINTMNVEKLESEEGVKELTVNSETDGLKSQEALSESKVLGGNTIKSVYAEGIPLSWDEKEVNDEFKMFGEIESIALAKNLRKSKRNDFAFINYKTCEAAVSCIEAWACKKSASNNGPKGHLKVSLAKSIPKFKPVKTISDSAVTEVSQAYQKPNHSRQSQNQNQTAYQSRQSQHSFLGVYKPPLKYNNMIGKREESRSNLGSSTTAELVQLLREQASWKQGGPSSTAGMSTVYHQPPSSGKQPFTELGSKSLYHHDPHEYHLSHLQTSNVTHPRPMENMTSFPRYDQQRAHYMSGSSNVVKPDPRYFQLRDQTTYPGSSTIYLSFPFLDYFCFTIQELGFQQILQPNLLRLRNPEMAPLYKNRLQNYAQKRNIPYPTYTVETQGPPHARLFKSQVTIDGNTYTGPEFCSTLKEAEHAAAKVALTALSQDGVQEDDCLYKSLLQELAQKKSLLLPVYATDRTGPPHMPCFVSTVEISGESYVGEAARTKKQSEMNAAKVAYTALTEGGPRANNATVITNIVGTSSSGSGSSSLQTVMTNKNEPTTSKMQTFINNRVSFTIPDDPEKAKGYLKLKELQEAIEKDTMTLPHVIIHQPQPKSTPNIVGFAKPDIKQKNHVIQAGEGPGSNGKAITQSFNEAIVKPVMDSGSANFSPNIVNVPIPSIKLTNNIIQAGEGSGSNGKRIQPFINESRLTPTMNSSSAMPHSTKIVIRPHVHGMTYDGPIQVSDDEWVAMKVNVHDGM